MRNRKKRGEHSAKDLEICLRHMVGKLLSFSQHQTDIKEKESKKHRHGLPRVNRFMVSFKSVQLHWEV